MRDPGSVGPPAAADWYLAAIAASSHDAFIATDLDDRVTFWSAGAQRLYGWTPAEARGRPIDELAIPEAGDLTYTGIRARGDAGEWVDAVRTVRVAKGGRRVEVSATVSPIRDDAGETIGIAWIEHDIGERVMLEREVGRTQQKFHATFAGAPIGIVIWDRAEDRTDGVILEVNDAFCEMFGYCRDDVVGRCTSDFVHPDDATHEAELRTQLDNGDATTSVWEARYRHAAGHTIWVRMTASTVGDTDSTVRYAIAHVENVTERKEAELRLAYQAFHDPLTGLPNRHLAFDRLRIALARLGREDTAVALLYVDLDWFKTINDRFGHAVGDRVLIQTAQRLRRVVRSPDTVGRLGGDEFLVICTNATDSADDVSAVAARVTEALAPPIPLDGEEVTVTASVGVAITCSSTEDPDTLLHSANAAMHRAKDHGRARFELFDEALRTRAVGRLAVERDLHGAIEHDEFVQYYQPMFDLASGRIIGVEALLRWNRPGAGLLAAAEFIDIAEESGLIVPVGDWVLSQACRQQAAWHGQLPATPTITINLSGREANMTNVKARIIDAAAATGADLAHLAIELTETVFLETVQSFLNSLWALHELGVRIILDDFGTGYSSLTYLKRFPVDSLKIDKTFVAGLGIDRGDTAIVKSIIALAHSLDLTAIAEGVEHPNQLDALRDLGCDAAQGYYLALPLTAPATLNLLTQTAHKP